VRRSDLRAGLRSLWRQGILHGPRVPYFRLLSSALRRDLVRARAASGAAEDLESRLTSLSVAEPRALGADDREWLLSLVDRAREALVRAQPESRLDEISTWAATVRDRVVANTLTADDLRYLYKWGREYFIRRRQQHRFPGAYLVKAFNLAIKGLHYEIVMSGIVRGR
jgi:hypothetical protein